MTLSTSGPHRSALECARARSWPRVLVVGCALALLAATATADDASYAEGSAAFERGDYATALRLWRSLAEAGSARAQFGLGLLYQSGKEGVPADADEALRWYRQAARQGVAAAQNNLAILYAEGSSVAADPELALHYWREAATSGYASAQWNLAVALDRGFGTASDAAEAARWYREAALQGVSAARRALAQMYRAGRGVAQDEAEARRWEEMAGAGVAGAAEERGSRPEDWDTDPHPVAPSEPATESAPPLLPDPAPAPSPAPCVYVQLASLPTSDGAAAAAHTLATAYAKDLAGLQPTVRRADLGARGVWFRVVAGPLCEVERARELCDNIRNGATPDACLIVSD